MLSNQFDCLSVLSLSRCLKKIIPSIGFIAQQTSKPVRFTFLHYPKRFVFLRWFLRFLPREQLQGNVVQFVLRLISSVENIPKNINFDVTDEGKKHKILLVIRHKNLLRWLPSPLKCHGCAEMLLVVVIPSVVVEEIAEYAVVSRRCFSDWHSCWVFCCFL